MSSALARSRKTKVALELISERVYRATLSALANLGMSTQLPVFGVCIAFGRPALFVWVALCELVLVLMLRRRRLIRIPLVAEQSA